MTYDLDRTILELEAELRNVHPDERRQIESELQEALAERKAASATMTGAFNAEPPH